MVASAKAVKENGDESFTLGDLLDIYHGKRTYLNLCRVFYIKYPQICATVSHKLIGIGESKYLPEITPEADDIQDTDDNGERWMM